MQPFGKMLILLGLVIVGIGLLLTFFDRVPFLGRLPGDISIKRENLSFHFPIATSIVISLLLSFALWIFSYLTKK